MRRSSSTTSGSRTWVADPRTTMRYDRVRASLDRRTTQMVAAYLADAAR